MSFEFVRLRKNPNCKVCGPNPEVTELIDYEAFCGVPGHDHDSGEVGGEWDITAQELAQRLEQPPSLVLLDVREPHELQISHIPGATLIPWGSSPPGFLSWTAQMKWSYSAKVELVRHALWSCWSAPAFAR